VIAIEEISVTGGDIEIALAPKATITLQPGLGLKDALINAHLAVKIADAWFEVSVKDPKDATKTTKPNVGVRTMLTMGPLKAHAQDGQFGIGITGPLGKPKVQPERPRTRVGGGAGARKMNVDQPGGESDGNDEGDDAEPTRPGRANPSPGMPSPETKTEELNRPFGRSEPMRPPVVRTPVGGRAFPGQLGEPRPKIVTEPVAPAVEAPVVPPAAEPPAEGAGEPEGGGVPESAPDPGSGEPLPE